MNNAESEWKDVDWRKLEVYVFKQQKRIFKASERDDGKVVRHLQKTLMRSKAAKLLAVRRVTQDNQGKKTAGVDGIKYLLPKQRLELANQLTINKKPQPTRRVWIPKPGKTEKRPLGIPTIRDRAVQALAKMALEPQWEARFEAHSYGFRPGRSAHDAIGAIYHCISGKTKYVLDADIARCFDCINQDALLQKVNTFPTLRRLIKQWLKAGVMEGNTLFPTDEGTPQGGVASPLLANIALHGMEDYILSHFPQRTFAYNGKTIHVGAAQLIRYADDLVILNEDLYVIQRCRELITAWLQPMGLELKAEKTRITHTLLTHDDNKGFDFLGFTIRQFPTKRNASENDTHSFKTLIKPSKEAIKRHYQAISMIVKVHMAKAQWKLISELNPVIGGWSNYYSAVVSKSTYSKLDHLLWLRLRRWALRRHPKKRKSWVKSRYWQIVNSNRAKESETTQREVFSTTGWELRKHADTPIKRHAKVQNRKSPYDGDWLYWSTRRGQYPGVSGRFARMMKFQKGKCNICQLHFKSDDIIETDHKIPRSKGGKDDLKNLQLLHRHCHDLKSATD